MVSQHHHLSPPRAARVEGVSPELGCSGSSRSRRHPSWSALAEGLSVDAIVLCVRFVRLPGHDPAESESRGSRSRNCPRCVLPWFGFACSASASRPRSGRSFGCVPHGRWALLDADILIMVDQSACLVEPVLVRGAVVLLPVLVPPCALSTPSAASGRCSRMSPS